MRRDEVYAAFLKPEITPYQSPVDGTWIDSRAQRTEDLKRNGCQEWHPDIKAEVAQNRKAVEDRAFAEVDKTIDALAPALLASL